NSFHKSINKSKASIVLFSIFLLVFLNDILYLLFYVFTNSPSTQILVSNIFSVFYNTIVSFVMVYVFIIIDRLRIWVDV
ncbi:MAG: hypothetical protein SVM86_01990, partial [Candidatus Cloacimonadota bacterium]|nr:hypothetical protein [Candidatus Cloacimonadota bacterium]